MYRQEGCDRPMVGLGQGMEGKPLRVIGTKAEVLPAYYIPQAGFGNQDITIRLGNGAIVTGTLHRIYSLPCGCKVSRHEECGGVCLPCREELEDIQENLDGNGILTPEQLDWLATPCSKHFVLCQYPFCSVGRCVKHIAIGPDGFSYCREHFIEQTERVAFVELEERTGFLFPRITRFFRSLFWTTS